MPELRTRGKNSPQFSPTPVIADATRAAMSKDPTKKELEEKLLAGKTLSAAEIALAKSREWIEPWVNSLKIGGKAAAQLWEVWRDISSLDNMTNVGMSAAESMPPMIGPGVVTKSGKAAAKVAKKVVGKSILPRGPGYQGDIVTEITARASMAARKNRQDSERNKRAR